VPRRDSLAFAFALAAAFGGAFAGCRCQNSGAELETRLPAGIPAASSAIAAVLTPPNVPRYQGPVGTVVGVVRVEGDAPPPSTGKAPPAGACAAAHAAYRHAFRKGPAGELGDAIVGVTGYKGYLLPRGDAVRVPIRECAFSARTYTLTFGQRLEIVNEDRGAKYLPRLDGGRAVSQMVALTGGEPVKLLPMEPGRYAIADDLNHPWMRADVFVLQYPVHTVSGVDGAFRLENVPVGKVRVHAGHPAIAEGTSREIEVKAGEETRVELTLAYQAPPPSAPSASPAAPPAPAPPPIR
jgi:carboxypeptidase family protein